MWALKLLLVLVALYGVLVLAAYAAQTRLLFPTSLNRAWSILPPNAKRVVCHTADGERLLGIRIPAPLRSDDSTVVLGFGGNASNAEDLAALLRELFPAAEVVAFHYRGYRPSTGRPSAAALLEDAPLVYDCATAGHPAKIVVVGFSIGSGVAARLARERPVTGLILVTPFDNLERLAREHYAWLPVRLLLRHHMSPVEDLRAVTAPVALIAAGGDTIIPQQRAAPLRKAARLLIMDQTVPGAGHNDIYGRPEFRRAMQEALRLIENRIWDKPSTRELADQICPAHKRSTSNVW